MTNYFINQVVGELFLLYLCRVEPLTSFIMEQKISFTFTPKSVSRHFGTTEEFVSEYWDVFEGWLSNHIHNNLGEIWWEDYDELLESINECLDEEISEFPSV